MNTTNNPRAAYNEAFARAQETGGARWAVDGGDIKFREAWKLIHGENSLSDKSFSSDPNDHNMKPVGQVGPFTAWSKTPRTDAALKWCPQCPVLDERDGDVCSADFARQLECELIFAQEESKRLINNRDNLLKPMLAQANEDKRRLD